MKKILCAALLLLPAIAAAQQTTPSRFEITPFVGYMRGGSVTIADSLLTGGNDVDVKVEQSAAWGVKVEQTIGWGPDMRIQYLLERAQSQLEDNRKLFGESPAGPVPPGSLSYTDISATYLQAGVMRYMGKSYTVPYDLRPYLAGGIGLTQVSFHSIPLDDQIGPSLSLGAGFQWALTERLGLRFETRGFYSHLSDSENTVVVRDAAGNVIRDCVVANNPCERSYSYPGNFLQLDITAGVSWKF